MNAVLQREAQPQLRSARFGSSYTLSRGQRQSMARLISSAISLP
jgi:hypothetical protein